MSSKEVFVDKVYHYLKDKKTEEGTRACHISKHFKVKKDMVYRAIKAIREKQIGVEIVAGGYRLSEFCSKEDDIYFIGRYYGAQASRNLALGSALPDIRKRWPTKLEASRIQNMVKPLMSSAIDMENGEVACNAYKSTFGL
jgi:hypothetical protein